MRDDELVDKALREIRRDTPAMSEEAYRAGYAKVLALTTDATAGTAEVVPPQRQLQRRRPSKKWWVPVAASVLLAAGVVTPVLWQDSGSPTTSVAAGGVLERAALAAEQEPPLAPGNFEYVRTTTTRDASLSPAPDSGLKPCDYDEITVEEIWRPGDPASTWLRKRNVLPRKWTGCTEAEGRAVEASLPPEASVFPEVEQRATWGRFPPRPDDQNTDEMTRSKTLAQLWVYKPDELLTEIHRTLQSVHGTDTKRAFDIAVTLTRLAQTPPKERAAAFRVITMLPGVDFTEGVANSEGRPGTAVSVTGDSSRQELLIDPESGEVLGYRTTQLSPGDTSMVAISSETAVVSGEGVRP
ncbi:CU044_5270 family protein [Amycolatopsis magusensis]|uniref:CU044_5270 family protein n=1 Tax=Amycolatopsis magusensis TaxID=882444 RepID=UPI0024A85D9C|nr:CU044_5270 family protein [Amycolatopsis magusensis]MDI5979935.1 CU044_5270 family protein [Amycolatopsis magusensis]